MTDTDKLFLQTILRLSRNNRGDEKKAIITNKGLLSKELLNLLDIENDTEGAWIGNVYVEFEPMFKTPGAKEWQK